MDTRIHLNMAAKYGDKNYAAGFHDMPREVAEEFIRSGLGTTVTPEQELRTLNRDLAVALRECADRLELYMTQAGQDPRVAGNAVAEYRELAVKTLA